MTRYEKLQAMSVEDLAWYSLTLIIETEDQMLEKLAMYGLDIDIVRLDPQIRHAALVRDLMKEDDDAEDT